MRRTLLLNQVSVGYDRRHVPILEKVALRVEPGQCVGVVGPNGSGKSTLVRALSRVLAPLAGTALLDSRDLYAEVTARQSAQAIGVVPQTASAILEFSVREIVEMGRAPHLAARPFAALSPEDKRIVDNALETANVADMAERLAPTLSGGEWQRVLLARTLAQQPDILLLDEPTAHLDLRHQRQTLTLVRALAHDSGKAVLAVLHDLNLAAEFCDYLYLVHQGRIAAEGTPEEVLTTANLAAVYHVPLWVRPHPLTHRPQLLPVPGSVPETPHDPGQTIHVICGAGTGAGLLLALRQAGWNVTCGLLAQTDPDAAAARWLDIPFPVLPPFSPPTPLLQETEHQMACRACAVVVAPTPWGPLNIASLDSALLAQRAGIPVFCLEAESFAERDHTAGIAAPLWQSLLGNGAVLSSDRQTLMSTLKNLPPARENTSWKP